MGDLLEVGHRHKLKRPFQAMNNFTGVQSLSAFVYILIPKEEVMKQKHLQLGSVWQVIVCIIIMLMLTNCRSEPQVVDEVVEPEPVVVEPEATAVPVEPTQPPEPKKQ